jgi:hypothetical protein
MKSLLEQDGQTGNDKTTKANSGVRSSPGGARSGRSPGALAGAVRVAASEMKVVGADGLEPPTYAV